MSLPDDKPKIHHLVMTDTLNVAIDDHASAFKSRDGATVGFAETSRDGVVASFDTGDDGSLQLRLRGRSPQNESDSLVAARRFVEALNTQGSTWAPPSKATDPADFESRSLVDPGSVIRGQVTRAIARPAIWHSLAKAGRAEETFTPTQLVEELRHSIIEKSGQKYSARDRAGMYLLLDANRLSALIADAVQNLARASLQTECALAGYVEVWVVGPTSETCYRLHRKVA